MKITIPDWTSPEFKFVKLNSIAIRYSYMTIIRLPRERGERPPFPEQSEPIIGPTQADYTGPDFHIRLIYRNDDAEVGLRP